MNIYKERGYNDREHYLESLAEDYGVELYIVKELAWFLGEAEDFDLLVRSMELAQQYGT